MLLQPLRAQFSILYTFVKTVINPQESSYMIFYVDSVQLERAFLQSW